MIYDVKVLGISVAKLKVEVLEETVYNEIPVYRLVTDIETLPWVSAFYHLHNRFNSYIDKATYLPIRIEKKAKEGTWTNTIIINIDQEKKVLYYKDKRSKWNKSFDGILLGLDSLLYYVRNLNLNFNEIKRFAVYVGENIIYVTAKVWERPVKMRVHCLSKKELETIKIQQLGDENVAVWFTYDTLKIPVKMFTVAVKIVGWRVITFEANLLAYKSGI